MSNTNTQALSDLGVSIWLDDLNRSMLSAGDLKRLHDERNVVGVTTNPTIFAGALSDGEAYAEQVKQLAAAGADVDEAVFAITTDDVREACDQLRPVFDATDGQDGRVSIEVDPRLARDTGGTIKSARALWAAVDRPNAMIKIPATAEGLPAITKALSEGISVNVTLIFSLDRYRAVMNAYIDGLEQAADAGVDLSTIRSVASFFVSRVDSEIDARLEKIDGGEKYAGQAGVANARLAYHAFEEVFSTPRWKALSEAGAHVQRPLWASTGVKNPEYKDTMYVVDLAVQDTVNTMPGKTLEALADHGVVNGDQVTGFYEQSRELLDQLAAIGVDYTDVVDKLEHEGVSKFEVSWQELLDSVSAELQKAGGQA